MDQNTTMVVRPTALVVSKQERIRILTQWKDSGLSAREYSQRIESQTGTRAKKPDGDR